MHPTKLKTSGFGKMLKQMRVNENMTLATFATRLGISAANLCDFEQGRKLPSPTRALEFGQRIKLPEELMIELSLEAALHRAKIPYSVSVKRNGLDKKRSARNSDFEILVVEDNATEIELILRAFKRNDVDGKHIRVFLNGEEVLDYLFCRGPYRKRVNRLPEVLLLDLNLPKISGIEVLKQLKSDPATCAMPIVVLTASSAESALVQSYQFGVNGYIIKPINFDSFSEAIGALGEYWVRVNRTPGRGEHKKGVVD